MLFIKNERLYVLFSWLRFRGEKKSMQWKLQVSSDLVILTLPAFSGFDTGWSHQEIGERQSATLVYLLRVCSHHFHFGVLFILLLEINFCARNEFLQNCLSWTYINTCTRAHMHTRTHAHPYPPPLPKLCSCSLLTPNVHTLPRTVLEVIQSSWCSVVIDSFAEQWE